MLSPLEWVDWFIGVERIQNRTGDWYFGVVALADSVPASAILNNTCEDIQRQGTDHQQPLYYCMSKKYLCSNKMIAQHAVRERTNYSNITLLKMLATYVRTPFSATILLSSHGVE